MALADLIPDADYGFQMRFTRGSVAEFFGRTAAHDSLIEERRRLLELDPGRYAAVLPEGAPLLDEATELAGSIAQESAPPSDGGRAFPQPLERCLALGQFWEPDFLLLKQDDGGHIRLYAGCVCFPSSWSLEEKIGRPVEAIHAPVPGLNAQIGPQIRTFLQRLKPGISWNRVNWGLSRSPELNQHPSRGLPRLDASTPLDEVWLRLEYQALVALPRSSGILFGIRLEVMPLRNVCADPAARQRLERALATMPEEVAVYKGIAGARSTLMQFCAGNQPR